MSMISADFRSNDFMLGRSLHLLVRLRDHVERLDDGAMHAADDIAVVLRALLHRGRGNDVLRRLQSHLGLPEPELVLSRAPSGTADRFSVGSLPTLREAVVNDEARVAGLRAWANEPLLRVGVRNRPMRNFTWAQFLNEYANKWGGAHVDDDIPQSLFEIDRYGAGGLSLSTYLLRMGAVTAWRIGQDLLRRAPELVAETGVELLTVEVPGSIRGEPRDRSGEGQLQWLEHDSKGIGLLWYVSSSQPSHLGIMVGGMPYTATHNPDGGDGERTEPPRFAGPRGLDYSKLQAPVVASTTLPVEGRMLTFEQVMESAKRAGSSTSPDRDS